MVDLSENTRSATLTSANAARNIQSIEKTEKIQGQLHHDAYLREEYAIVVECSGGLFEGYHVEGPCTDQYHCAPYRLPGISIPPFALLCAEERCLFFSIDWSSEWSGKMRRIGGRAGRGKGEHRE